MRKIINLSCFQFKTNMKRKSFLIFVVFFVVISGLYSYRQRNNQDLMGDVLMMFMRVFYYYNLYLVSFIFAKEYECGIYKQIYTAGISKVSVNFYKTFTITLYALLFTIISAIGYIMVGVIHNKAIDIQMLGISLLIYVLIGIHTAQFAGLVASVVNSFRKTLLIIFLSFAITTYTNNMYNFLTGKQLKIMDYVPCIEIDKWMVTYEVSAKGITTVICYTAFFFILSAFIQKRKEISCVNKE